MHNRSRHDRLLRGQAGTWARLPDSMASIASTLKDMMYGTVGSYDATNKVITTTGTPVALPTGTPAIDPGIKVYDREGAGFSASDTFYAIRQEGVHTDGTHGQVDWVVVPTAAGANKIFLVVVNVKSASQGAGSWITSRLSGHRYFAGSLGTTPATLPATGDIWILSNDHRVDLVDTSGSEDAAWPYLTAHAVFLGFRTGETWDPQTAQYEDEGSPPAWNSSETTYGNEEGDIQRVTHAGYFWDAAVADVPTNSEPADANGNWTKGAAIQGSDSRDVYRVDALPPTMVPGFCPAAVSAATDQGGATPSMQSTGFQTYVKDEGGAWGYGPLLEGVQYNLEEAVEAGTPGFVNYGYAGMWLLPGCGPGSGYSA